MAVRATGGTPADANKERGMSTQTSASHRFGRAPRVTLAAVVAAAIAVGVAACGGGGGDNGGGTGSGGDGPIKIAGIFDITGANAGFGSVYVNSTKLAFQKVNAEGGVNGHKLELNLFDTATDPGTATLEARKAATREGMELLYGGVFDPPSLAIAEVAESTGALFYSPAAVAPELTDPLRENVFAVDPTIAVQMTNMAKLMNSMGAKKIGLIKETTGYGEETEKALEPELEKYGMTLAANAGIAAEPTDATNQVLEMKNAGVEAIVLGVAIPPSVAIIKAMSQQGVEIPIVSVGGGLSEPSEELLTSSSPIEYYAASPLACPLGVGGCGTEFVKEYTAEFHEKPIVWAAQGYVAALAFVDALEQAKEYTPDAVREALETMPGYKDPLIPGDIKFSDKEHLGVATVFLQGYKEGEPYFFGNEIDHNNYPSK
jgi:branched-chain amino acid transport system substrate-binding protein